MQMCAKLRLDKAAVMGQSLGAVFALRCARDPELKVTFEDTTVCLVSPWVPLVATGELQPILIRCVVIVGGKGGGVVHICVSQS